MTKLDAASLAERLAAAEADGAVLSLRGAGLTSTLAVQLADFLESNVTVTELDVSGNAIGSHGSACLAASIGQNRALQKVTLARCGLKSDAVGPWAELLRAPSAIRIIDLSGNQIDDDASDALETLASLVTQSLDLRKNELSDASLRAVARGIQTNHNVQQLRVDGNQEDDAAMARRQIEFALQRNRRERERRELLSTVQAIAGSAIELLQCHFDRVDLSLAHAQLLSAALRENRSITSLRLCDNALPAEGMRRILDSLQWNPSLTALTSVDNPLDSAGVLCIDQLLRGSRAIRHLTVGYSVHTPRPASVGKPGALSGLHRTLADDTLPLETLELRGWGLRDTDVGILVSGIAWACRLEELSLRDNLISQRSIGVITRMMQRCSLLRRLDLTGNSLSLDSACAIAEAASAHPSLRYLSLGHFAEAEVVRILKCLATSETLVRASFSTKTRTRHCAELLDALNCGWEARRRAYEASKGSHDAQVSKEIEEDARRRAIVRRLAIERVAKWLNGDSRITSESASSSVSSKRPTASA